jgi:hypothetical protein
MLLAATACLELGEFTKLLLRVGSERRLAILGWWFKAGLR